MKYYDKIFDLFFVLETLILNDIYFRYAVMS